MVSSFFSEVFYVVARNGMNFMAKHAQTGKHHHDGSLEELTGVACQPSETKISDDIGDGGKKIAVAVSSGEPAATLRGSPSRTTLIPHRRPRDINQRPSAMMSLATELAEDHPQHIDEPKVMPA